MQVTKRGKIYEEVLRIAELFSDISDGCIRYKLCSDWTEKQLITIVKKDVYLSRLYDILVKVRTIN
jgi:hypothetical protein